MHRDDFSPASVPGVWLACVLMALLLPVALIACTGDEPDTVADVFDYIELEYAGPIVNAMPTVVCEFVDPRTENPDCAAFVAAVEDSNPTLDRAIVRLRDIVARANPWELEVVALLNDGIAALVEVDRTDELIIDSWRNKDINAWREGWTLSREAGFIWARFVVDVNRFGQESESPSASEQ